MFKTPHRLASVLLACILAACGGGGSDTPGAAPQAASAELTASGSATYARISYAVGTSAPTELTVALPWSITLPLSQGQTLSVTATNAGTQGQVALQVTGSEGGRVSSSGSSTATVRFSCCD